MEITFVFHKWTNSDGSDLTAEQQNELVASSLHGGTSFRLPLAQLPIILAAELAALADDGFSPVFTAIIEGNNYENKDRS